MTGVELAYRRRLQRGVGKPSAGGMIGYAIGAERRLRTIRIVEVGDCRSSVEGT